MNYPEKIVTVDNFSEYSFKEKGSTFLGQVYHCENETEVNEIMTSVKKKYYDATHHCFSYRFTDQKFKYSDDGEPNGTAGVRILNAIDHFNLVNVVVVVIRYFGGTKLGVGLLGKAYYTSALTVLEKADKISKALYQKIIVISGFDSISHIHRIMSNHEANIVKSNYQEEAEFECGIKPSSLKEITIELSEVTNGKIKLLPKEEFYYK
ncbi:MAG: YigZ family protein [Ignavibacteriaceae bacterium]